MSTDKFQAQKEAIKFKKERPLMCEISFAEGFEHAMRLVKANDVLGNVIICDNCDKNIEVNCLCEACLKSVISKGN